MWNVYSSGHKHSQIISNAFASGARLPWLQGARHLAPGGIVTYGALRGLGELLRDAQREGRGWLYLDNGYFRPGHYDGYYRATLNAYQHDGTGNASPARWERLGKQILPWRTGGRSVMICPPGEVYAGLRGFNAAQWLADTLATLKQHTDRPIVVRSKPKKGEKGEPLWTSLRDCHALVAHSSNSAVEALQFGIPVFCTAPCAASLMGSADICTIETPRYPDGREQWAWNLAAAQWTLAEMRDGTCWSELNL